ncbi:penicillin acylase family protein [Deinococcus cellulosilyticus]|uniref:Penicillin acylase n=1 Tax=Deinococcus cellulosilyticus (strain DSM 18568 / NBRC 106333 / KACC 11606 / 5516J-15) TaxID=1223518 RepID=A0A511N4B6_DEIC1|nr:penicillin acylase family protein [Deinococcus cellulosilyticus]GEM47714.1 penicillin acylase [Deinococcus cellulosilyticus NBRC 106333 = KACC 11606]
MRLLRAIGWIVLLLLIIVAAAIGYLYYQTYTPKSGDLKLQGLSGEVKISWDSYGVPHIKASSSDLDAIFALGYVHAQDRIWQMDFQRRVASGRLSEVIGEDLLDTDKFLRTWGFYKATKEAYPALSDRSKQIIEAYTGGVNAYLATKKLPLEFTLLGYKPELWTPVDTLAWAKMMAFDLGGNWESEILASRIRAKVGEEGLKQFYAPIPDSDPTILNREELQKERIYQEPAVTEEPVTLLPETLGKLTNLLKIQEALGMQKVPDKGSNNWVVAGSRTVSGKPLLADDPHLSLSAPALWYMAEIQGPTLHAIGGTIPGLPAVVIGRNDRISWAVTNTAPDVQDLFLEPADAQLTERTEVIKIKGKPDITIKVRESKHGPIISDIDDDAKEVGKDQIVALKWTALEPGDTTMDAFIGLNYAQNWDDFTSALKLYVTPTQNFLYADVDGNIGYYAPGKIPIRDGWDGSEPVSGDKDWKGYIPFEELPHVYNPEKGYIATANERPVADGYLYPLGTDDLFATRYRKARIEQLIQETPKHTIESFKQIQNDSYSLLWDDLKPYLLKTEPKSDAAKKALETLSQWDGFQKQDSVGSTIYAAWYKQLTYMVQDELDFVVERKHPYFVLGQLQNEGMYCKGPQSQNCAEYLSFSLENALKDLSSRLGENQGGWQWGKLHKARSAHVFKDNKQVGWIFNRETSTDGGFYTVNVGTYDQETFKQTHGPSYRQIVDLSNMDSSQFVFSLGQSGNVFSAHYADLSPLWRAGEYVPMKTFEGGQVLTLHP